METRKKNKTNEKEEEEEEIRLIEKENIVRINRLIKTFRTFILNFYISRDSSFYFYLFMG